jgi:RNA polymerase sigma-70 factor (ECF subfamily)
VLQEALVRVWQVTPRFVPDGRPEALLRLAIRIARNLAVDLLRRRRLDPVDVEALKRLAAAYELVSPPPDRWSNPMLRQAIEDCRQLPAADAGEAGAGASGAARQQWHGTRRAARRRASDAAEHFAAEHRPRAAVLR